MSVDGRSKDGSRNERNQREEARKIAKGTRFAPKDGKKCSILRKDTYTLLYFECYL